MRRDEVGLIAALTLASFAWCGCQRGPGSPADANDRDPTDGPAGCADVAYEGGLHFVSLEKTAIFGQAEKSFYFPIFGHSALEGAGAESEVPRVGERYVAFDKAGWLGVAEVTDDCLSIPCADCATTWYCKARWLERSARGKESWRLEAVGPTHERWSKMRVTDLRSLRPPCPKGVVCNDRVRPRPEYLAWKTVLMLDLNADGQVDVAARARSNCGASGRSVAGEIQVQDGKGWHVIERSDLGFSTWLDDGRDVEVPGDESFPPPMP